VPGVLVRWTSCDRGIMRKPTGKTVVMSFRADRKMEDLIENCDLSLRDLVEAGLLSKVGKKMISDAIRLTEDRIEYYSELLVELKRIEESGKKETASKQSVGKKPRSYATVPVKGKSGSFYWITPELAESTRSTFSSAITESGSDAAADWSKLYTVDDIPECELTDA